VLSGLRHRDEEIEDLFATNMLMKCIRLLCDGLHLSEMSQLVGPSTNDLGLNAVVDAMFEDISDSKAVYLT
jgi:hypothetical protein